MQYIQWLDGVFTMAINTKCGIENAGFDTGAGKQACCNAYFWVIKKFTKLAYC